MSEEGDEEGRGCSHVNHTDLLLLLLLPFVVHHGNGTAWQRERTVDGVLVLFCRRRWCHSTLTIAVNGHRMIRIFLPLPLLRGSSVGVFQPSVRTSRARRGPLGREV